MRGFPSALVLTLLLGPGISLAESPLRHNPFQKPNLDLVRTETPNNASVSWTGELRGVISGGKEALINVDGEILMVGDEHQGFRLIDVRERTAVFEKNGKRMLLSLDQKQGIWITP